MAIFGHIGINSTPHTLCADGSPEGAFSNRGSGIVEQILWVKISNFKKIDFCDKIYENSLKRSVTILEHKRHSTPNRPYANGHPIQTLLT